MMLAVVLPSRGLVFSKTMECVIAGMQAVNALGIATKYYASHDLPIPDCHNCVTEKAMADPKTDKILFLEEDMYLDEAAFLALATSDYDIATLNYNDKNGSPHGIVHFNEEGEVLWCGVGATAVKRKVLEDLGTPYFRTDVRYKVIKKPTPNGKVVTHFEELESRSEWQYGGQDVDFCARVRKLGYKIHLIENYRAIHFQLLQLGETAKNNGCHTIRQV